MTLECARIGGINLAQGDCDRSAASGQEWRAGGD